MSGYEWYKAGTVIVRNGENEVVGANTEWLANDIKTGDIFIADNQIYEIAEVVGNTSLKLMKPYEGISNGASEYAIITRWGEVMQADIALKLQQAITKWNDIDRTINTLSERTQLLANLGLYVDTDGDLAQGEPGSSGTPTVLTSLPVATSTQLGGVRIGRNIKVQEDGTISIDAASPEEVNEMANEVFRQ